MKVCMISGYSPNSGRGAETTQLYVKELLNHNCVDSVTILSNISKGALNEEKDGDIKIVRVWSPNSWRCIFNIPYEVIRRQCDIYHIAYGYLFYGGPLFSTISILFTLFTLKVMRKPTVLTIHQVFPINTINKEFRKTFLTKIPTLFIKIGFIIINKVISLLTSRIVTLHNRHNEILKEGYGVKNTVMIPMGLVSRATHLKEEAKKKLGLSGKNVLLVYGFITQYKGVEYAISAMPLILEHEPNSVLIIAGSIMPSISHSQEAQEYIKQLKRSTEKMRKEGYIMMNNSYIPDELVDLYFSSADVVILPNIKQSGPSEILTQSYLSKIPLVATNIDYFRSDVINYVTGLLIPPKDSESLSKAVVKILRDENLRKNVTSNIEKFASDSNIINVAKKLVNLYKQLDG